ncbi:hypothetical protein DSM106972_081330 [Dulcicalothrix desertica PCC 7102]|uniref:DUF4347 domain-containing protein n=1 Tax=Dulcicalothrix desertica PCC 7102 TaxID=232991 RepID=A0A3S1AD53_9CYAN|nr:DUF4347 domain-containing protein [Dulcicalothrix desertica]RUS98504.1 hypothetical protein DSM106972_081330 [Dulcicalothrix desertica PCC 7102]TWH54908.1 FG-GAP repeat protein [Dulcicalothrix desertica PCC 7102]
MSYNSLNNKTRLQSIDLESNNSIYLPNSETPISPLELSSYTASSSSLLFIDASVSNYESLLVGLLPLTEVHVLNAAQDAIAQITDVLSGRQGISSLQIISHGNVGSLDFASGSLNTNNIRSYTSELQTWGKALTADADILLYGCNVATGEAGANFVQYLSLLTGADIAASNDLTGSSSKGGNWVLEATTGLIEPSSVLEAQAMAAYESILNSPITINTASFVINNPTPATSEQFGSAITSGSSNILISAPGVNSRRGEAYLYNFNGTLSQTFINPSSSAEERFGFSVASNGNEYFVSAPYYDASVADVGRAYKLNSNGVVQSVYNNSVNNDDSEFGTAIAILNDGTVAIGAPEKGKSRAEDNAGEVRLFKTNGTITNIINPESILIQDARFGAAIAAYADKLIIGAPGYFSFGRAYSYDTNGNSLYTFTNPNGSSFDFFGIAVASNSAGTRVIIGAPGEDNGGTDAGVAYLYDMTTATPTLLRTITNPTPSNRGFGTAVAFIGNDILIGSPGGFSVSGSTVTPVPDRGVVYRFDGDGAVPTYALEMTINNPSMGNDGFGGVIRVLNDNQIAIGAPYTDVANNTNAGAVYVYNLVVNTAPVNLIPTSQTINENSELVFSTNNQNAITVQDADASGNPIQVTLAASNGTLSLGNTNGLQFTAGDGTDDASITIVGTLNSINTALNGMRYKPTANFSGTASIQITTNDLGNTGVGGAKSDTDTISLTIKPNWEIVAVDNFTSLSKQSILQRSTTGAYRLWYLNGNNTSQTVALPTMGSNWQITSIANFDGNTTKDIFWQSTTGENRIWRMSAAGAQVVNLPTANPNNLTIQHIGDFESDGDADILVRDKTNGMIAVWESNPNNAEFIRQVVLGYVPDNNTTIKQVSDLDGDGDLDIFWYNPVNGAVSVWEMQGTSLKSGFGLPTVSDTNTKIQLVADFDGDNDMDILWYNGTNGFTAIWEMNGVNLKQGVLLGYVGDTKTKIRQIADFDGDKDLDILWYNDTTGFMAIWVQDGVNFKQGIGLADSGFGDTKIRQIADFDGDNDLDFLWYNSVTGFTGIWVQDGVNFKQGITLGYVSDTNTKISQIADFDGDKDLDFLWHNQTTGFAAMWSMNGVNIGQGVALPPIDSSFKVHLVGDFNGDGKLDVVWNNSTKGATKVWLTDGISVLDDILLPS